MGRRIHDDEKMTTSWFLIAVISIEGRYLKIPLFRRDKDFSVATLLRNDTGWLASSK